MLNLSCPSCGSPVVFASAALLYSICPACQSTVVRRDTDVSTLGKVGLVQEDGSPIQLGTGFRYEGKKYEVVGRIQSRYEAGFWNEWYALEGDTGVWLGEAQGMYFVNQQVTTGTSVSHAGDLQVGTTVFLNRPEASQRLVSAEASVASLLQSHFVVTSTYSIVVTGCQGSLPFVHQQSYQAQVADLKTSTNVGATLDFSETPPLVFVGRYLKFDELAFDNLREIEGW